MDKNSLGCGKMFKIFNNEQREVYAVGNCDFICGVANAWGEERFCVSCKLKLKEKWRKEDLKRELKGGLKK